MKRILYFYNMYYISTIRHNFNFANSSYMKQVFFFSLLAFGICFSGKTYAQTVTVSVSGTVTSQNSKESLPGVSITLKGSNEGTLTNVDGVYNLSAPNNGVLVFSFVGYESQEVEIANRSNIHVALQEDTKALGEVVVVGYTTQSKLKTTAAVSKLDATELVNTSNSNPVQAVQGKIAGVSIPINSGQPGSGAVNIVIRGGTKNNVYGLGTNGTSADNTEPLVVIDGVFRTIDDINPDNIESLQVMKDAASTAVYGARGANGVIVIKTKGGKFNSKTRVTLNQRFTWENQVSKYNYLNATDYLRLARTTVKNTYDALPKDGLLNNAGFSAGTRLYTAPGQYSRALYYTALYDNIVSVEGQSYVDNLLKNGWMTMDDPINPGTKLLYADNNYQDKVWVTGVTKNTNVGIDGGSESANYNVNLGFNDQKGTYIGTKYKRFDGLGNFGFKIGKSSKLDVMVNYQNVQPNYLTNNTNDLVRSPRITPLIRSFDDNGDPLLHESYSVRNRFHQLKYDDLRVQTERLITKVGLDLDLLPGLRFRPSVSYQIQDYKYQFFRKETPADFRSAAGVRNKSQNTEMSRQLMIDQILQYQFNLGPKNSFSTLVGFNYTQAYRTNTSASSLRANNDYIFTINEPATSVINGVVTSNISTGTSITESKSASYFGQVSYDYDSKYLFSASLRYDGFSNFAPENKYALFPSLSAGWNIHRESFWKFSPTISSLKLRGSWGKAGLNDISIASTYGGYGANNYAQSSGILLGNLANPNLRWESTETLDIALEAGLLNDRISLVVDFYDKQTKDRLAGKPLPSESPFSSITYNNGTLQNKGVEIEIGAQIIKSQNFNWRTNFSFALNQQKILKLPNNGREKNRQGGDVIWDQGAGKLVDAGGIAEGERPYALYVFRTLGIFSTEEEAKSWNATKKDLLASASGQTVGKHAGDYIFDDINNDGVIDSKDQVFLGYRTPNRIGGMQNNFTYKAFSLRFNMDYALGHYISNGALARSLGTGRGYNEGAPAEALGDNIWQKEGDTDKYYARFSFADFDFGQRNYLRFGSLGNNATYGSDVDRMVEKGDFLAFRELTFSYDVPKSIISRIKASSLNLFVSVFNLGYITKYKGFNPEIYSGYDPGGYPRPRQVSIGGTLRF